MNQTAPTTVRLRAMEPEDLDFLYGIENDTSLWNLGATNVPYSRYALHEFMASATGDIYADRQVRLVVENGQGESVGLLDLVNFDPRHCRAEVGIVIQAPHRRQGYALAALQQLHTYAAGVLHLHQLYAITPEQATPTISLFRKAGYAQVATLPHWLSNGNHYSAAVLLQAILA